MLMQVAWMLTHAWLLARANASPRMTAAEMYAKYGTQLERIDELSPSRPNERREVLHGQLVARGVGSDELLGRGAVAQEDAAKALSKELAVARLTGNRSAVPKRDPSRRVGEPEGQPRGVEGHATPKYEGMKKAVAALQRNRTLLFVAVPSQNIPADAALRSAVRQTWAPALQRSGGTLRFFVKQPLRAPEALVVLLDDEELQISLGHANFVQTASVSRQATSDLPPHRKFGCGSTRRTDFVVGMAGWALRRYEFDWWLRLDGDVVVCVDHLFAALGAPPLAQPGAPPRSRVVFRVVYAGESALDLHRQLCTFDEFFYLLSAGAAQEVVRAWAALKQDGRGLSIGNTFSLNLPSILRSAAVGSVEAYDSLSLFLFDVHAPGPRAKAGPAGACTRFLAMHKYKTPQSMIDAHHLASQPGVNRTWRSDPGKWRPVLRQRKSSHPLSGCGPSQPWCALLRARVRASRFASGFFKGGINRTEIKPSLVRMWGAAAMRRPPVHQRLARP
eukprot:CAMPEP_0119403552 /NCGR_PEP_ID=MMETSP1334-20130426/143443_1 /TAXON_ID=127549 /ORGANISM="Calcidiscus leptoporus, Strain RCC1130" /LENGTH=503 /DNA_ID=CAMNT_0007427499 /DNA_START=155 /DNA_END=1668 /DNA_ORIENTATION=+